jgi:thiamine-phosphate pyrophosphorylase
MKKPLDLSLYICVGPSHCPEGRIVDVAVEAARNGVTLVQLRDKTSGTREMVRIARELVAALEPLGVPLLINDRIDVALASNAAGVHVGQSDMAVEDARRLLGDDAIIGLTVKNPEQAKAAPVELLDYVSFGGVFPTTSKQNPDAPIGTDGLAKLVGITRARCELPLCAIAGIDRENAADVIAAGTDGVCIVSAITLADDPGASAMDLSGIIGEALSKRNAA